MKTEEICFHHSTSFAQIPSIKTFGNEEVAVASQDLEDSAGRMANLKLAWIQRSCLKKRESLAENINLVPSICIRQITTAWEHQSHWIFWLLQASAHMWAHAQTSRHTHIHVKYFVQIYLFIYLFCLGEFIQSCKSRETLDDRRRGC